jgi:ribosomal protein S6
MSTTEDRQEELTVYELAYLVLPSIPEDGLPQVVAKLKEIIKNGGGSEIASEEPFMHPLAYAMTRVIGASKYVVEEAYIGWIKFETTSDEIEKIKSETEKISELLRFLIVKVPRESNFTFAAAREAARLKALPPEAEEEVVAEVAEEPVADAPVASLPTKEAEVPLTEDVVE